MNDTTAGDPAASVLTVGQIGFDDAATLLAGFGLRLHRVAAGEKIPGSYWCEPEAGIIAANVEDDGADVVEGGVDLGREGGAL